MAKKPKKTLVTFLLDRSGSMDSIKPATIEAFNAYVDGLQAEKKADIDFTLLTFDSQSLDKVCVAVPVKDATKLNNANYTPRGGTPLVEAAYKTIKAVEQSVGQKKTQVVICIQTDGQENCSSAEYSFASLNVLIKEKTKLGWQFNFMGAGIDAYAQATLMGLGVAQTMSYNSADLGATRSAFIGRAASHTHYASGMSANTSISSLEKQAAGDKFDPTLNTPPLHTHTITTPFVAPKKKSAVDDFTL